MSLRQLIRRFRMSINRFPPEEVCSILGAHAETMWAQGDLVGAETVLLKAESIARESKLYSILGKLIGTRALVKTQKGEVELALELHQEEEELFRRLDECRGLAVSLGNQAVILKERGVLVYSMALLKEQESLCRELTDQRLLCTCLGNQGGIFLNQGDLLNATAMFTEVEGICRDLDELEGLAITLLNQARLLKERAQLPEAEALCIRSAEIFQSQNNPVMLVEAILARAKILAEDRERSSELAQEAYDLASAYGLGLAMRKARNVLNELASGGTAFGQLKKLPPPEEKARIFYQEFSESADFQFFGSQPAFNSEKVSAEILNQRISEPVAEIAAVDRRIYACPSPWHAVLLLLVLQHRSQSKSDDRRESMVFRGQGDYRWPLVPSILREGVNWDVELTSLKLFTQVMERLFKRERDLNAALVPFPPIDQFVYEAAAQHYGIRTGLLDFTTDPSVAVAFANGSRTQGDVATVFCLSYHEGLEHGLRVILPHPYFTRLFVQRGVFVDTADLRDGGPSRKIFTEVRFPKYPGFQVYRHRTTVDLLPLEPFFDKLIANIRRRAQEGVTEFDDDSCERILSDAGVSPLRAQFETRRRVISDSYFELLQMVYTIAVIGIPGRKTAIDAISLKNLVNDNMGLLKSFLRLWGAARSVAPVPLETSYSLLVDALDALVNKGPQKELWRILVGSKAKSRRYDMGGPPQLIYGVPDEAIGEVVSEFERTDAWVELTKLADEYWLLKVTRSSDLQRRENESRWPRSLLSNPRRSKRRNC